METMGSPWQCNTGFLVGKNGIITILQSAEGGTCPLPFEVSEVNVAYIPSRHTPQHSHPQLSC